MTIKMLIGVLLMVCCTNSKANKQATPPDVDLESPTPSEPPAINPEDLEWKGYGFIVEDSEMINNQLRNQLNGFWMIGMNMGSTPNGIRWEGLALNDTGSKAGKLVWYTSDSKGASVTGCLYKSRSKLTKVTFSKPLTDGSILIDQRFEDGSFQQHLVLEREGSWRGRTIEIQPIGLGTISINDLLRDLGGSIAYESMKRLSTTCDV